MLCNCSFLSANAPKSHVWHTKQLRWFMNKFKMIVDAIRPLDKLVIEVKMVRAIVAPAIIINT